MPFELQVPRIEGEALQHSISSGEALFLLGANGTGKSSLMHRFFTAHYGSARRISAHRQTWFMSGAVTLSPEQKRQTESNIQNSDRSPESRWADQYSAHRASIAIFDLIDAENIRARRIASAVDQDSIELAKRLSAKEAPISVINELLQLSNLPIVISVHENEQVLASKSGSDPYSIAELSDGERNALLIAASVLTVKPDTLLLIDEPERHLHRSIISPLLTLLFAKRLDCAFVVSTHEVMLPLDNPNSRTLLLRGCKYENKSVTSWDADLVPTDAEVDEELKKDILGSRRKMLFVEGIEGSLDKPLYSVLFPNVSVVPKASCKDVEHAVKGIRAANNLHWLRAFGVVDNDGRSVDEIENLKTHGVYALPVFSVESVYYDLEVQRRVTERHAGVTGEDALARIAQAKAQALAAIGPHVQRLSERAAERALREEVFRYLPGRREIIAGAPIVIDLDVPAKIAEERAKLQNAIDQNYLAFLIARYPVRETAALNLIAESLGFRDRTQYESAVRQLMIDDHESLGHVRSLFGTLTVDIGID